MKTACPSPTLRKAIKWSWLALAFGALHIGSDLADNRAYVLDAELRGVSPDPYHIVPTDTLLFVLAAIASVAVFILFGYAITQASRGSNRWLFALFLFDLLLVAVGNGAVIILCPPPCGLAHPHLLGLALGTVQDGAHVGSLTAGTVAALYVRGARRSLGVGDEKAV